MSKINVQKGALFMNTNSTTLYSEPLYLKPERHTAFSKEHIEISDVCEIYCQNQDITYQISHITVYEFHKNLEERKVISVLYLVEEIKKHYPNLEIKLLGDTEFIIEHKCTTLSPKQQKLSQTIKIILVCLISFFGAGFTIMTYNTDVSVNELFTYIYKLFMGKNPTGNTMLQLGYAIGLGIGLLFFFNHLANHRFSDEPTPLEVEMRLYEQNINDTTAINAGRHKKIKGATGTP